MGIIKLTEKPIGSNPSTNTHFVVTQPETVDGITKESVRRLNRAQVIDDTLSTAGMAADAKAVGDEIGVLKAKLNILYLYGDESEIQTNWENRDKAKMKFRYVFVHSDTNEQKNGWCYLKLQGQTSIVNPKHNFNIQFFKDPEYKNKDKTNYYDFGKHPKFTIKANYIDYSQARNIVSAKLWGDVVHSRKDMRAELSDAPNHGAVDGYPIILMMNDRYYGLYTFNMPKEDWMLGLDEDNPMTIAVGAENGGNTNLFKSVGVSNWTVEVPDAWTSYTDETSGVTVNSQAGFLAMLDFVVNSTDEEFVANIGEYFNLASLIDYYIYTYCVANCDTFEKNQLLCSWDCGKTWYFTAYDMDETFGIGLTGPTGFDVDPLTTRDNRLFKRLETLFSAEIYSRYAVLRESIFSNSYMIREFELFFKHFPDKSKETDYNLWNTKNKDRSSIEFFENYIINRMMWCDEKFEAMNPDFVACTGITLDSTSLEFDEVGDVVTLTATPTPENQTQSVVWSSSDPAVATVNNGVVTIVADGECTITVTCGSHSDTCDISVSTVTLPEGYTKIPCVVVNGVGFDTMYVPNANTEVLYKVDNSTASTNTGRCILGSAQSSGYDFLTYNYPTGLWAVTRGGHIVRPSVGTLTRTAHKYRVTANGEGYIDDNLVSSDFTDGGNDTYKMTAIFGGNRYNLNNGGIRSNEAFTGDSVYYLKVYESGSLLLHYVPCVNSENVVGFYEVVNGTFHTSSAFSVPS